MQGTVCEVSGGVNYLTHKTDSDLDVGFSGFYSVLQWSKVDKCGVKCALRGEKGCRLTRFLFGLWPAILAELTRGKRFVSWG